MTLAKKIFNIGNRSGTVFCRLLTLRVNPKETRGYNLLRNQILGFDIQQVLGLYLCFWIHNLFAPQSDACFRRALKNQSSVIIADTPIIGLRWDTAMQRAKIWLSSF